MRQLKKSKIGIIGCGFWARYQIPAWLELDGVEIVSLYNRTIFRAIALASQYNIASCYDDVEKMFLNEKLDVVDIITDVDTHAQFTEMAARHGVAVICQKPMAPNYIIAKQMMDAVTKFGVPFYIHENFRWQVPIRKVKEHLESGIIGNAFKANVKFCSAFPVFDNQPFLATLEQFILTDIGSHILDICRFLFGEAVSLYCQTASVNPTIKGEDVANVFMKMARGLHCYAEMSYASILEKENFPQTLLLVEGEKGSIQLTSDFEIKVTTSHGTSSSVAKPVMYDWLDPAYAVVHSSIVDCNRNILQSLQGKAVAETTGVDNFETVKLVWAAYESAMKNKVINLNAFDGE